MKRIISTAILTFSLVSLFLVSCDDWGSNINEVPIFPEKNVSFQEHVQPYMMVRCSFAGCHSDYSMAGGRRMTTYFSYFEAANAGLITIGKPEQSLLTLIMDGTFPHVEPIPRDWITDNATEGIKTWIREGAKNN